MFALIAVTLKLAVLTVYLALVAFWLGVLGIVATAMLIFGQNPKSLRPFLPRLAGVKL